MRNLEPGAPTSHSGRATSTAPLFMGDTPSTTDSPTPTNSQLTPESGDSSSSDNAAAEPSTKIRGTKLGRLQTDFSYGTAIHDAEDSRGSEDNSAAVLGSDEVDYSFDKELTDDEDEGDLQAFSKTYTIEEERAVVKKFDKRLTLFMGLLYMLSFLDRSNIGNAKIAGLTEDLRLTSSQYSWTLTAFYITYILFEWMTLLYKVIPAHIYITICVFSWGLIASFQCLVSSFWVLILLRSLLGIAEAAFGPGLPFYLSFFYKREELAFRTGLFISAAPLATSFASSLAWVIVWLSKDGPIAPWRALFLFEGFPSVLVAVFAWVWVPDGPGRAKYLTHRERKVAKMRLKGGGGALPRDRSPGRRIDWREIGRTLCDPKAYLTALMFFSCNVAFSSLPVYLPTILRDMGYSTITSQALSAPPYIFSFTAVLLTSSLSDRSRTRSPFIITHALLSSLAYLLIALVGYFNTHIPTTLQIIIRYLCIFPAAAGFFSAITLIITWTMDNQPAKEGKGTGMAIMNVIGQCGPLVGTRLYPDEDGPWFVKGMLVCAVFMAAVACLAFGLRWILVRENLRSAGDEGRGGASRDHEIELAEGERAGLMGSSPAAAERSGGNRSAENRFVYIV